MRVHTFSLYAALKLILAYINELLQKHLEKRKKKKTTKTSLIKRGHFIEKNNEGRTNVDKSSTKCLFVRQIIVF